MKSLLVSFICVLGSVVLAGEVPEVGQFKGLSFSSPTSRHPVQITGGTLTECKAVRSDLDMTDCQVENGSLTVSGSEDSALNVKFTKVTVLRSEGEVPGRHYYYLGSTDLTIGDKTVTATVSVTVNTEDRAPDKISGFIQLVSQNTQDSFEAYRAN